MPTPKANNIGIQENSPEGLQCSGSHKSEVVHDEGAWRSHRRVSNMFTKNVSVTRRLEIKVVVRVLIIV